MDSNQHKPDQSETYTIETYQTDPFGFPLHAKDEDIYQRTIAKQKTNGAAAQEDERTIENDQSQNPII